MNRSENIAIDGVTAPKLIVPYEIIISDNYIIYKQSYYAPVKVVISAVILRAKLDLEERKRKNIKIEKIEKYILDLKKIITLMNRFELSHEDEDLESLLVFDGRKEIRDDSKKSFELHYEIAKKELSTTKRYLKSIKDIRLTCLSSVSNILKNDGINAHKSTAQTIIVNNGLDIPEHY